MKKITKDWLLENGFDYEDSNDDKWNLGRSFNNVYDHVCISYAGDFSVSISDNYESQEMGRCITPNLPNLTHEEELIQFLNLLGHKL